MDKAQPEASGPTSTAPVRRARTLVWILAGVVAVAAVVLAVVMLGNRGETEPIIADPVPGETIVAPVPTPAVAPIERPTDTPFLAALPSTVLGWAVAEQTSDDALLAAGAVEAYFLTYTDGSENLTLATSQWRTPEAAQAAIDSIDWAGQELRAEEVLVDGVAVGHMVAITFPGEQAEGTTPDPNVVASDTVIWRNGNTVFHVLAPVGTGLAFYDAMGM